MQLARSFSTMDSSVETEGPLHILMFMMVAMKSRNIPKVLSLFFIYSVCFQFLFLTVAAEIVPERRRKQISSDQDVEMQHEGL